LQKETDKQQLITNEYDAGKHAREEMNADQCCFSFKFWM